MIALSSYTTVLGRRSLTEADFRAHWRDVHGPLRSRVPGLGWYVQHHVARHHDDHLWPLPEGVGRLPGYALDGMVEIGWADADAQATFQEAAAILFSDEQNVFAETAAYPLPTGSITLLDRTPDPVPNGPHPYDRLHVHVGVRPGTRDAVVDALSHGLLALAGRTDDLLKVRVHPLEPHDNSTPDPPAPDVAHTVPTSASTWSRSRSPSPTPWPGGGPSRARRSRRPTRRWRGSSPTSPRSR